MFVLCGVSFGAQIWAALLLILSVATSSPGHPFRTIAQRVLVPSFTALTATFRLIGGLMAAVILTAPHKARDP